MAQLNKKTTFLSFFSLQSKKYALFLKMKGKILCSLELINHSISRELT